jgi:hypothetical protein
MGGDAALTDKAAEMMLHIHSSCFSTRIPILAVRQLF